jgi:hypothetical protein
VRERSVGHQHWLFNHTCRGKPRQFQQGPCMPRVGAALWCSGAGGACGPLVCGVCVVCVCGCSILLQYALDCFLHGPPSLWTSARHRSPAPHPPPPHAPHARIPSIWTTDYRPMPSAGPPPIHLTAHMPRTPASPFLDARPHPLSWTTDRYRPCPARPNPATPSWTTDRMDAPGCPLDAHTHTQRIDVSHTRAHNVQERHAPGNTARISVLTVARGGASCCCDGCKCTGLLGDGLRVRNRVEESRRPA